MPQRQLLQHFKGKLSLSAQAMLASASIPKFDGQFLVNNECQAAHLGLAAVECREWQAPKLLASLWYLPS